MEINEFIEKFAEQFDNTDISVFKPDTRFRDLDEWSSLVALSIIAMIDEEFDVTLKGEDMRKANTPAELLNVINNKLC